MARHDTTIDGHKVTVMQHAAIRRAQLKARILKIVLPVYSTAAPAIAGIKVKSIGEFMALEDGAERAAPILQAVAQALDPSTFESLLVEILRGTSIILPDDNGVLNKVDLTSAEMINLAFDSDERELTMYKVAFFALKVNVLNFLSWKGLALSSQATPTE